MQEANYKIHPHHTRIILWKKEKSLSPKRAGFYLIQSKLALRNCAYWAAASAGTTIYTSIWVDLVLAVTLSDSADRAFTNTRTAADARTRNYVCHKKSTS